VVRKLIVYVYAIFIYPLFEKQPFLVIFEPLRTVYAHNKVVIQFAISLGFEAGQSTTTRCIGSLCRNNGG